MFLFFPVVTQLGMLKGDHMPLRDHNNSIVIFSNNRRLLGWLPKLVLQLFFEDQGPELLADVGITVFDQSWPSLTCLLVFN